MAVFSIRRRVGKLELLPMFLPPGDYRPFTLPEVEAIAKRARNEERFSPEEMDRLYHHSPIVNGEYIIDASRRYGITVKQYIGIDLAEV